MTISRSFGSSLPGSSGELLKDHAGQIWVDEDWCVDATDEAGLILFVIQISATDMAATRPMKPLRE